MVEKIKKISGIIILFLLFVSLRLTVNATGTASLYVAPSSGSYNIGDTFKAVVNISSPEESINAISSVLTFPKDKLEVVSVSKENTIISFWVQQPSFSNAIGNISFEGVILNPGFTGEAGSLVTVTFKVISAGKGNLSFASAAALANDGLGTNVLKGLRNASYILGNVDTPPVLPTLGTTPTVIILSEQSSLSGPVLFSTTHPDSNLWYSRNDVRISWKPASGVTNIRHIFSKDPKEPPTDTHSTKVDFEDRVDVENGIWYFNVQFGNAKSWSEVSSFKIQIDNEPPKSLNIKQIEASEPTNPSVKFSISAEDEVSGMDHYKVRVNNAEEIVVQHTDNTVFRSSTIGIGNHSLNVKAFDKAGNFIEKESKFEIAGLKPPIFTEYPLNPKLGDSIILKGKTSYDDIFVKVYVQKSNEESISHILKNDSLRNFVYDFDEKFEVGIYKIWAEVIDEKGAKSNATEPIIINPTSQSTGMFTLLTFNQTLLFFTVLLTLVTIGLIIFYLRCKKSRCNDSEEEIEIFQESDNDHNENVLEELVEDLNKLEAVKKKKRLSAQEKKVIEELSDRIDEL